MTNGSASPSSLCPDWVYLPSPEPAPRKKTGYRATSTLARLTGYAILGRVAHVDPLVLRFQLHFIGSDERPNLVRHIEQFQPLFFVQGYGKASHAIDRDCSLFAHLHADAGRCSLF